MNRGVIAYMREGTRCAKNTFKNFINNFKYYFLGLVIFFGALCPITLPFVSILSIRMARLAERDEDIQIFKSFERVDNQKTFWTVLGFYFFLGIFFLSGLILIALLAGVFAGAGILIGGLNTVGYILAGVLAFPFAIILLVYLIVYPFMFMPAIYLYDCNPKLGLSGMFYNSIDAMRKTGKWTIFMMSFLYGLRILFWVVLTAIPVIGMIVYYNVDAIRIICAVATLGCATLLFFKFAKLSLGYQVSLVLLFNDICSSEKYISLDQTEENTPKNVYGVSKRTLRAAKKEQLLLGLFTNGKKLVDPEGVDQTKLPNEVEDIEEEIIEEDVLAEDVPESVSEVHEIPTIVNEDLSVSEDEIENNSEEIEDVTEFETLEPIVEEEQTEEVVAEPVVEEQPVVEESLVVEETVTEAVVEEAPVVEKPKRGRKKATPVVEEPVVEETVTEPVVEESPVVEEVVDNSVTEEEIGNILDNILNVDENALEEQPVVEESSIMEEAVAEPVVEDTPVVEKPKRGRKKVVKEE